MKKQTQALVSLDQHIAEQQKVETPKSHRPAVTKEQSLVTPTMPAVSHAVPFYLMDGKRPEGGKELFSFTEAWIQVAGLYDGKHISEKDARILAGSTAINYHTKKGNLVSEKQGMTLTVAGRNFFKARELPSSKNRFIPEMVEGFKAVLTTGKMDERVAKVVNAQNFIKKFD